VRLVRISGVDLNLFEFDYDLSWSALFLNDSGKVLGRFGGRDAKGPDPRNTLAGLRYAMEAVLAEYRKDPVAKPAAPPKQPMYVEKLAAAKSYSGCIHCHQVKEIVRQQQIDLGTWQRDSVYTYPLPENVGITLDRDRGDLISAVKPASPAGKIGMQPGDILQSLNGLPVHSFADAQYALHRAPPKGEIPVIWLRAGRTFDGALAVEARWRRTNITWRPSLLDLLPSLSVYGTDLTAKEKKAVGLDEKRLAFRQDAPVHSAAKAMGVQENDIILGVDNQIMEMSMEQFLGHVRQNYLIGETLTLNILRNGKRMDLKVKLK